MEENNELFKKNNLGQVLSELKHWSVLEARALMIAVFYIPRLACRIVGLRTNDFKDCGDGTFSIRFGYGNKQDFQGFHNLYFPLSNQHLKELFDHAMNSNGLLFHSFNTPRHRIDRYNWKNGYAVNKESNKMSGLTTYWVKRWTGKTPNFFRKNQLELLKNKGASDGVWNHYHGGVLINPGIRQYFKLSDVEAKESIKFFV